MNIFRSEDDVRSWSRFDEAQGQIMPVEAIVGMSAHPLFAERLQEDYYPRQGALLENLLAAMTVEPE